VPNARCSTLQGSANVMWPVVLIVDHMPLEATAVARAPNAPLRLNLFNCKDLSVYERTTEHMYMPVVTGYIHVSRVD
jgi:hypothetical protein